jgi:hypothetical protein
MIKRGARAMAQDWLTRYGLAEGAGITCALIASAVVRHVTRNPIAAAYGAAWGETLGYAAVIAGRDVFAAADGARLARAARDVRGVKRLLADWAAEFGPAGLLDTLVTRPACMGLGMRLLGPMRGLVSGKVVADVLFYIPVILMYERRKRSMARASVPERSRVPAEGWRSD